MFHFDDARHLPGEESPVDLDLFAFVAARWLPELDRPRACRYG